MLRPGKWFFGLVVFFASFAAFGQTTATMRVKQTAVTPEPSRFSLTLISFVDKMSVNEKNYHFSIFQGAFKVSPIVNIDAQAIYTGLLQETPEKRADFFDPEIGISLKVPVTESTTIPKVELTTGAAFVIPATKASNQANKFAGWIAKGGMIVSSSHIIFKQVNNVYFYSYRQPDRTAQDGFNLDTLFDESGNVKSEPPAPQPTYIYSEHKFNLTGIFTPQVFWKNEFVLYTMTTGEYQTTHNGRINSELSYAWSPNFITFGGLSTLRSLSLPDQPAFFTEKNTAVRGGIVVSI